MHAALCKPSGSIVNGEMDTTWFPMNFIGICCMTCSGLFIQAVPNYDVFALNAVGGSYLYIFN